jgi:hypothetical protein
MDRQRNDRLGRTRRFRQQFKHRRKILRAIQRDAYSHAYSYGDRDGNGNGNAAAYANTEAASHSTPPALITQMIPKLRRKMGYLFRFRIFAYSVHRGLG